MENINYSVESQIRFYRNIIPEIEDIVMVEIHTENEYGYYGNLLEYNLDGFLPLTELIKGKLLKKNLIKIGEILPFVVIRSEKEKNIINLSKKKMDKEQEKNVIEKYKYCKNISKLINFICFMYNKYCIENNKEIIYKIDDFMEIAVWKLYDEMDNKSYEIIYKTLLQNPKMLFDNLLLYNFQIDNEFITKALNNIEKRLIRKNMLMELDLNLIVFAENAVKEIKNILDIKINTPDNYKINILIGTPPLYKIKIEGPNKIKGNEILNQIQEKIKENCNHLDAILKFNNVKIIHDSVLEFKFLSENDYNTFNF